MEPNKRRLSEQSQLSLVPRGALEHQLHLRVGPTLRFPCSQPWAHAGGGRNPQALHQETQGSESVRCHRTHKEGRTAPRTGKSGSEGSRCGICSAHCSFHYRLNDTRCMGWIQEGFSPDPGRMVGI